MVADHEGKSARGVTGSMSKINYSTHLYELIIFIKSADLSRIVSSARKNVHHSVRLPLLYLL